MAAPSGSYDGPLVPGVAEVKFGEPKVIPPWYRPSRHNLSLRPTEN